MTAFASPAMPQPRPFPTLAVRQSRRRSADPALGACRGHDCDSESGRNPNRERLQYWLNPAKSSSTAIPAVRLSTPTPLKSP